MGYMNEGNMDEGNMNEGNMNEGNMSEGNINEGNMREGNISKGNEDESRKQDMEYGIEPKKEHGMEVKKEHDIEQKKVHGMEVKKEHGTELKKEHGMEPKMGQYAGYDGERGSYCDADCDRDQGIGQEQKDNGKNLSEHFFHIGMLLHRYQTEAYKENGPMGSPFKGQGRILAILKLKPEISHRELSYLLGISTQSMSELLRKLENKGYVKRVPSEHDRRSMDIILTEEGRRAVEQADGFDGRDTDRLFDCFDDQEQKQFKGFLERLEDEIIRHLDPEHPSDYTFGRMKEMHDYILSRGHSRREHFHGDGPLGNGFGRGRYEDERDPGRRFDRRRR